VVGDGAYVTVKTLPFVEGFMRAAALPFAGVDGAVVSIVAGVLVGEAVAIVVHSIATLGQGFARRASA